MPEKTIELDIPLLLPHIDDSLDDCLVWLEDALQNRKGILKAHLKRDQSPVVLCIHYDPDWVSLSSVHRMAQEAGAEFSDRYRHEQIPFTGMDNADAAVTLSGILEDLPGMLHAQVNYAAGLAFVAYDATRLSRDRIEKAIRRLGVQPYLPIPDERLGPGVGSAPTGGLFSPGMQKGWMLVQVGLSGTFFLIGWAGESYAGMPAGLALAFFLLSYLAGGYHIATHAIPGMLKGKFDTDVLMLAAALGAAVLGEWAEGAFLLFLFSLGHAGEHYALDRARRAVNALGELIPKTARVKRDSQIVEVSVQGIRIGEIVVIRPGDRIPVDGDISAGESAIDQSPVTGESIPVHKTPGMEVFAGTVNLDATLEVKVTHLAADNTLARVMQLVAEAQSQQSPTQQFAERFTRRFVPAVLILVLLVIFLPPLAGWMPLQDSFYRAMLLLVAASPCALALGTPAAVLAGVAQAARNGVLIKGGVHLENLGGLAVMAFDKTGTLTEGRFQLTDLVPLNGTEEEELLRLAGAVEQQSSHPLAQAILRAALARHLELPAVSGLENVPGLGVRSEVRGRPVLIGSLKLFGQANGHPPDGEVIQTITRLEEEGKTTMAVSAGGTFLGVLALADTPRPEARAALQRLRELGIQKQVMLTGDNVAVARQIGRQVGVTDVRAGLLPEQKLLAIHQLRLEHGEVAMTGDGVNDAPALATATVGIAMGGAGAAVALETADVALMGDDLGKLPFAVGLSRASRAIIRQNLAISLGVIGLLILTSVLGVVALSGAVVLHEGSTILVVLNALRLLRYWEVGHSTG